MYDDEALHDIEDCDEQAIRARAERQGASYEPESGQTLIDMETGAPLIKGGQGRTAEELGGSAFTLGILLALLAVMAFAGAYFEKDFKQWHTPKTTTENSAPASTRLKSPNVTTPTGRAGQN